VAKNFRVAADILARDKASKIVRRVDLAWKALAITLGGFSKVVAVAVVGALAAATAALLKFGRAAGDVEQSVEQLRRNLESLGEAAEPTTRALDGQAVALDRVSRATRRQILEGQALIAGTTQNAEQIEVLTRIAVDASAALGIKLADASGLLAAGLEGNAAALETLGVSLGDASTQAERFEQIAAQAGRRFAGEALEDLKTFNGTLDENGQAWGRVASSIGRFISESTKIKGAVDLTTSALNGLSSILDRVQRSEDEWIALLEKNRAELEARRGPLLTLRGLLESFLGTLRDVVGVEKELATTREQLGFSTERVDEAQARVNKKIDEYKTLAGELGITLERDVNTQLDKQTKFLELADDLLREGELSNRAYADAQRAVAAAAGDAAEKLGLEVHELEGYSGELERAIERTEDFDRSARTAANAQDVLTASVIRTRTEFDRLVASGSRAEAVQASLAGGGTLTQGGTRLRLPGGGSVLTSPPGFGGSSRTCKPSRFFEGQCTII
jgi:hypothetical protein